MRSQALIIILLAVISKNVSAGLVRYHDRPVRVGHYIRLFNQSTLAAESSQSTESTSITSSILSTATTAQAPSSSASTSSQSKQIGSVPAQGSGPGAATFDLESFTQALSSTRSTSFEKSTVATSLTGSGTASSQEARSSKVFASQSADAPTSVTPSVAKPTSTFVTRFSLGTGIATPASQPQSSQAQPTASQTSAGSQSVSSSTQAQSSFTAVAGSRLGSIQSSRPTLSSSPSAASTTKANGPSLSNVPVAPGGNLAIANAFNQQFKTMTPDSSCNSKDRTQANACINGLFAQCNDAGRYTMTACPQGQQCFALPMPAGSTGIFVQCDKPSDANQKLQPGSGSISTLTVVSTTPVTTSSLAGAPATLVSTASVSSSVVASSQTGNSATLPSVTFASTPLEPSRSLDSTILSALPSTTQTISQTLTTSSITQPTSTEASGAGQPGPAPLVSKQSSTTAAASSTDVPLIISFPSSSQQSSVQQAKSIDSTPAPTTPSSTVVQQSLAQPSPSQQPPISIPTVAATISSAADPGITIVPLGNFAASNREKTVTVTVTTTERL